MITGGRTQARDETFTLLRDAIILAGYVDADIIWQDELEERDVDTSLVLVYMQHVVGMQAAITQGLGVRRHQSQGFITVELRSPIKPLSGDDGLTNCDTAATVIENALRGRSTPNGVWFRDVVGREVPPKDGNARTEVKAEFIYQEMT